MALICLPCEIYQREFDAKLLLAYRLASEFSHDVLIGYDKYFNSVISEIGPVVLQDKSLSSIMFKSRIEPVKRNRGKVLVSDEEGINNLGCMGLTSALARVDPRAVNDVDVFACWGSLDEKFYSKVPNLESRMLSLGNCRSDLLSSIGKSYYENLINSIREVFGNFILVSDNFSIERLGFKGVPRFAVDDKTHAKILNEFSEWEIDAKLNRQYLTEMLLQAASDFPNQQFVIRPHPVCHPGWWHKHFGAYRNVHISSLHAVEPWIHASLGVLSMGCTVGLQGLVAKKPVFEIANKNKISMGVISELLPDHIADYKALAKAISKKLEINYLQPYDKDKLGAYWVNTNSSSTSTIAETINNLAKGLPNHTTKILPKINSITPDRSKWYETPTLEKVLAKLTMASKAIGGKTVKLQKVSQGVWHIKPG